MRGGQRIYPLNRGNWPRTGLTAAMDVASNFPKRSRINDANDLLAATNAVSRHKCSDLPWQ